MVQKIGLLFVLCLMIVVLLSPFLLLGQTGRSEKRTGSSDKKSEPSKKTPPAKKSPPPKKSRGSSSAGTPSEEREYWNEIKDSEDPADFEGYLQDYPNGNYAAQAQAKLNVIEGKKAKEAWEAIKESNNPAEFETYIQDYPYSVHAKEARAMLNAIKKEEEKRLWVSIEKTENPADFENYIQNYPNGSFIVRAKAKLKILNRKTAAKKETGKEKPNASTNNTLKASGTTARTATDSAEPPKRFNNRYDMEFVYIPPGEFMMGSSKQEINSLIENLKLENPQAVLEQFNDELPKRKVTFNDGFYMATREVTHEQWLAVMGTAPGDRSDCSKCPVDTISWDDAKEFIKKLNEKDDRFTYRLPSEAEWEYACRAGTTTLFAFGDTLTSRQANFNGNHPYPFGSDEKDEYRGKTTYVGSYKPNAWGLYDMHGNVYEWCEDIYYKNYNELPTDGSANRLYGDANIKVKRGGSYNQAGRALRSADRSSDNAKTAQGFIGFRLVATLKNPE